MSQRRRLKDEKCVKIPLSVQWLMRAERRGITTQTEPPRLIVYLS